MCRIFLFFLYSFLSGYANFILMLAIVSSELTGATKSGIEQQISNKKALNFYATFIRS